jgi:hypothetical protein
LRLQLVLRGWAVRVVGRPQAIHADTKPCPHCGMDIELRGGCDHVRCPACKQDWCWTCGGKEVCPPLCAVACAWPALPAHGPRCRAGAASPLRCFPFVHLPSCGPRVGGAPILHPRPFLHCFLWDHASLPRHRTACVHRVRVCGPVCACGQMSGTLMRTCATCKQIYLDHQYFRAICCVLAALTPVVLALTVLWMLVSPLLLALTCAASKRPLPFRRACLVVVYPVVVLLLLGGVLRDDPLDEAAAARDDDDTVPASVSAASRLAGGFEAAMVV